MANPAAVWGGEHRPNVGTPLVGEKMPISLLHLDCRVPDQFAGSRKIRGERVTKKRGSPAGRATSSPSFR